MRSTCLPIKKIGELLIFDLSKIFKGISLIFLQWQNVPTFDLANSLGLPRTFTRTQLKKKVYVARDWKAPKNLPSSTVEAKDFIFDKQLVLPRPIIKTDPSERCACHWVSIAYQNLGVQIQILHSAKIRQAHHKKKLLE